MGTGRDDLTIDAKGLMAPPRDDHLDAAGVLEQFTHDVANLPAEIEFMQDEIAAKERQILDLMNVKNARDASLQKWIRLNGSHVPNPKEKDYSRVIRECFDKAMILQSEKLALAERTQEIYDRHLRRLDVKLKTLHERGDLPNDPPLPSLLEPSPNNASFSSGLGSSIVSLPSSAIHHPSATPDPVATQSNLLRLSTANLPISMNAASASPATPAASLMLNQRARESSAGAANKRQRLMSTGLGNLPATSSGLARHSSQGPGTPKPGTPIARAGSAGPRVIQKTTTASSKKLAPHKQGTVPRKSKHIKSGLSRVKRTGNKNSPHSHDSELSDADTGSADEDDEAITPPPVRKDGHGDEEMVDIEDDEGGDDTKYCICTSVSYGDMVACDNDKCPFEWFHWACVGLKSEPVGKWYCPDCTANLAKNKK